MSVLIFVALETILTAELNLADGENSIATAGVSSVELSFVVTSICPWLLLLIFVLNFG